MARGDRASRKPAHALGRGGGRAQAGSSGPVATATHWAPCGALRRRTRDRDGDALRDLQSPDSGPAAAAGSGAAGAPPRAEGLSWGSNRKQRRSAPRQISPRDLSTCRTRSAPLESETAWRSHAVHRTLDAKRPSPSPPLCPPRHFWS